MPLSLKHSQSLAMFWSKRKGKYEFEERKEAKMPILFDRRVCKLGKIHENLFVNSNYRETTISESLGITLKRKYKFS